MGCELLFYEIAVAHLATHVCWAAIPDLQQLRTGLVLTLRTDASWATNLRCFNLVHPHGWIPPFIQLTPLASFRVRRPRMLSCSGAGVSKSPLHQRGLLDKAGAGCYWEEPGRVDRPPLLESSLPGKWVFPLPIVIAT